MVYSLVKALSVTTFYVTSCLLAELDYEDKVHLLVE